MLGVVIIFILGAIIIPIIARLIAGNPPAEHEIDEESLVSAKVAAEKWLADRGK